MAFPVFLCHIFLQLSFCVIFLSTLPLFSISWLSHHFPSMLTISSPLSNSLSLISTNSVSLPLFSFLSHFLYLSPRLLISFFFCFPHLTCPLSVAQKTWTIFYLVLSLSSLLRIFSFVLLSVGFLVLFLILLLYILVYIFSPNTLTF
jgi:hypothetical protein